MSKITIASSDDLNAESFSLTMEEKEVLDMQVSLLSNMQTGKVALFENGTHYINPAELKGLIVQDAFYDTTGELIVHFTGYAKI